MANRKLENVWKSMEIYNFETAREIENEMLCLLCNKLLINAYNTPCGCRFCFTCISEYLNENKRNCPGNTEECKLELISLNENIVTDNPINIKISKLKVKCPENTCEFIDELREIENHLRICNNRSIECPYSNIGCNKSKIFNDKMSDHLQAEILIHTKLLMDFVGNLYNEMSTLKTNNIKLSEVNKLLKTEIDRLKLDCERRQGEIFEIQCKLDNKNRNIDQLNVDIICLKNDNVSMKENVDKLILDGKRKEIGLAELHKKCDDKVGQIKLMNEEIVVLRNVGKNMREDFDGLELNAERNNEVILEFNSKCQQIENIIVNTNQQTENKQKDLMRNIDEIKINHKNDLAEMSNKIDKSIQNVDKKLLEIEINQNKLINREFLWKIDKFSEKMANAKNGINRKIYSESFFSHQNGYKMCLSVYPDGYLDKGNHLSVFLCLIKGDFDDILEWPFRYKVTFVLINQQNKLNYVSMTRKYANDLNSEAFIKPTNKNIGWGFFKFISQQELSTNSDLTRNDQIFIKCTINI